MAPKRKTKSSKSQQNTSSMSVNKFDHDGSKRKFSSDQISSRKNKFFFAIFVSLLSIAAIYWKDFLPEMLGPSLLTKQDAPDRNHVETPTLSPKSSKEPEPPFQINVQNSLHPTSVKDKSGKITKTWKEIKPTKKIKNSKVRVYVMDDFLLPHECEGLIRAHENHLMESSQHDPIVCFSDQSTMTSYLRLAGVPWSDAIRMTDLLKGTRCLNESFSSKLDGKLPWSYSTSFYPGESPFSKTYENRVERYTGLSPKNGGKFQVTSYNNNVGYKIHTDCIEGNTHLRDRYATILVYLQDVERGGETEFTELGIKIKPRKGRALLWNNMDSKGSCDLTSYHKANRVLKGKKYILQRWYYYHNFPYLGQRTPPPSLPVRSHELTPRVSCDRFESGSCRWYDEWNYDHLLN